MAIVQCASLHYYDNEKFNVCPHCARLAEKKQEKKPVQDEQIESYAMEYIKRNRAEVKEGDSEKTIGIYQKRGASYTAGWLVCVKGAEYGRDFPLYAGFNRIGRAGDNDIVLTDAGVSREEHCSVIYEEKKNIFYILSKAGNLTYLEDMLLEQAQEIESGQVITVGETQLEFVAFCTGEKRWIKN